MEALVNGYPLTCDCVGWIQWFLRNNPGKSCDDAVGFTMFEMERLIGRNRGSRLLLQDMIHDAFSMRRNFPEDWYPSRVESCLKSIRELDRQDRVAREFQIENWKGVANSYYSVPRADYDERVRLRLQSEKKGRSKKVA